MVKEHIFLDKLNGIQIYHTGEHNGLIAVTKLVDSNYVSFFYTLSCYL